MSFDWHVFWDTLTSSVFLHGALISIVLAAISMVVACLLGLAIALGRDSSLAPVRGGCWTYVWILRAIPTLLILLFVWNALPQLIPGLKSQWFTPFIAGFAALSFNEAAYMAEITRAGLLSVDPGQRLAARALGMTPGKTLWKIVIPQAIRVAIPPTANEFITLLKLTSLASVISLRELLTVASQQVAVSFTFAETYAAAAVYYLVIVSALMYGQSRLEKRYRWSSRRAPDGRLRLRKRGAGDPQRPPAPAAVPASLPQPAMTEMREPSAADRVAPTPRPQPTPEVVLKAENIKKSYHGKVVLRDVSLEVRRGMATAILGASGSGKSTLLRCCALLEPADAGRIYLEGQPLGRKLRRGHEVPVRDRDLCRPRSQIGMVFQQFNLFPHLTATQNVMVGLVEVRGIDKSSAREQATSFLTRVGLAERANAFPNELSGGQQQRVAIARALVMRPKAMLFDEPTSALDPELVREVLDVIEGLARDGMTMLIVTHELAFARRVADEVVLMHDGVIVEAAPPEQFFERPQHERTRRFLSFHG